MSDTTNGFTRLQNYLKDHRKVIILIFAVMFLLFGFQQVYAVVEEVVSALTTDPLTMIVLILGGLVNILAWMVGQLIVLTLGMLVIPILGYNSFGSSAIIDIGWPLVRDVVNMFVIVVLLFIAIKTILNSKSANWEQQLPRLFIAVILVNFSRTITLLIVDIGQVVMFTFVNALRDIAAGNFINLFQLNSILSLVSQDANPLEAFGFLGTAYANLVLLGIVLAVFVVLAIVFVYRIVMIWVLVILSPIAFFAKGVGDILPGIGSQAGKWWDKLVGVITLGPILTFFLWLGLAAASSGGIASSEGFNTTETADSANLYSAVFNIDQMLSLMIGIILIMVGFQAASGAAGAIGGFAGTLINEKSGQAIAKNVAKFPASVAYRGARAGARQIEGRTGAFTKLGQGISSAAARSGVPLLSQAGVKIGGMVERTAGASNKKADDDAKKKMADMGEGERMAILQMAAKGQPLSLQDQRIASVAQEKFTTSGAERDKQKRLHEKRGGTEAEWDTYVKQQVATTVRRKDAGEFDDFDDAQSKALNSFLTQYLNHVEVKDAKGVVDPGKTAKAQQKIIDNKNFDVSNLSKAAIEASGVQQMLENKVIRTYKDKDGNVIKETAWDKVEAGVGVKREVQDSRQGISATFAGSSSADIAKALEFKNLKVENITATDINTPADKTKVVQAVVNSGVPLSQLPDGVVRDEIVKEIADQYSSIPNDPQNRAQRMKYEKAHFSALPASQGNAAADTVGVNKADGSIAPGYGATVQQVIQREPHQVFKFGDIINNHPHSEIDKVVADTASVTMAEKLGRDFLQAINTGNVKTQGEIKKSVSTLADSVEREYNTASTAGTVDKELENKHKKFKSLKRTVR